MPDLLVPLYKLPSVDEELARLRAEGIVVRRAFPFDLSRTRRFITKTFSEGWADETEAGFAHQPITCWIAIHEKRVIGFACVDATMRGFLALPGSILPFGAAESGPRCCSPRSMASKTWAMATV
jgi:hypothetical protein